MEQNHDMNSAVKLVETPQEIKIVAFTELCEKINYAFRMESPQDFQVNGRVYPIENVQGGVKAIGQNFVRIAENIYSTTQK